MGKTYSTHLEDDIDGRLIFIVFVSPLIRNKSVHYIGSYEEKYNRVTLSDLCSKDLHLNFGRIKVYLD